MVNSKHTLLLLQHDKNQKILNVRNIDGSDTRRIQHTTSPLGSRVRELPLEHVVVCYQSNQSKSMFVVGFVVRLRSAADQADSCHMESGPGWSCRLLSHATATHVVIDRHLGVR